MMDSITYNYHDATLETISLQQHELVLIIVLYPIFYPNHPKIKLMISGITNIITCEKWVLDAISAFQEEHEATLGSRINDIYLNKNFKNQLLVSIDSIKTVKLNFEKLYEIEL